ncbi:MAG TPA: formylglycine-generating enzyme family protein [Polyangiaceae bacterium]|jgi:formylglycine-generating enzyme required for sulfatase activity|nr:formylglycine-generating enzyme family protein [Polyangiaceae bacterium]
MASFHRALVLCAGFVALAASAVRAEPSASSTPLPAATASAPAPIPDDMLPVPGGAFTMGADGVGERDEQPAHTVTVQGFLLDKTEVTNEKYLECVAAQACRPYRDNVARGFHAGPESGFRGPTQPVVGVSWYDASAYCAFRGKRLPREAEWERAARGEDNRKYAWGDAPPDPTKLACFGRKVGAKGATTMPVGSYPDGRGPYGHFDLTGNVWEWTNDIYDPMAYTRPGADRGIPGTCAEVLASLAMLRKEKRRGYTGSNPIPTSCERALRGGAFNYPAGGLRASNRVHHPPEWRMLVAGFRCAKDD